jgi:hypothetical protein
MAYKISADFVVLVHLGWIIFLILGALPGRRILWIRWLHIGGLVFSLLLQVSGWYCPLTYLEAWLRTRHSPTASYAGSFISHYAEEIVYLDVPRPAVWAGTIGVVLLSGWWYRRA